MNGTRTNHPSCVDCGVVMHGSAKQRRRCDECQSRRVRHHYRRNSRVRYLRDGEKPPGPPDSRYVAAHGYVRLRWKTADGYLEAYEHRVIAGANAEEQVHHIDGDRSNNHPSNLLRMTPAQHADHHARHGSGERSTQKMQRINADEAVRLYALGYGTQVIGKMIDADPASVWRTLKRRGVKTRPQKGGVKK